MSGITIIEIPHSMTAIPDKIHGFTEGVIIAGNYRVLGTAGVGGMGVVLKALDLKLQRTVALKFLPLELAAHPRDKERFLREARIASGLDHPNIGVVHGVEETPDGRMFLVMAFYEGQSLAEKIRLGVITPREAVKIAAQLAEALEEAHAHGIVHRDLKPSNVMMTASGLPKIVDFGLAYVMTSHTASRTGSTGTMAYMAPEQALGKSVDARSDVWALGVVLAEMLTGVNPFHRDTLGGILYAILNDAPVNLDHLDGHVQKVLYRALAKDPEERYRSCAEMALALQSLSTKMPNSDGSVAAAVGDTPASSRSGYDSTQLRKLRKLASASMMRPGSTARQLPPWMWTLSAIAVCLLLAVALSVALVPALRVRVGAWITGSPKLKHIAVLPLTTNGTGPDAQALANGLMDSLTGRLANLGSGDSSLWVVPSAEVRRLKVTTPEQAQKVLGATLVVQGSVRQTGKDTQLRVELIDSDGMRELGSAKLSDPDGDLATLETDAVERLADLMNVQMASSAEVPSAASGSPAAYAAYLRARGYLERYDKLGNLDKAIAALRQTVVSDPDFALGYAELGNADRLKYWIGRNPKWLKEAETNCTRSLQLNPSLPSAYTTLGMVHNDMGEVQLAQSEFQHALMLDPRNARALDGLGKSYELSGRISDAEKTFIRAAYMRPEDWKGFNTLGGFYDRQEKYNDAARAYKHALQLTPDNSQVLSNLAGAYLDSGDTSKLPKAEKLLQQSIAIRPTYPALVNLGLAYYEEKNYQKAAQLTEQGLAMNANDYLVWGDLVVDYQGMGAKQKARAAMQHELPLLQAAVQRQPQNVFANGALADLYAALGMRQKALTQIQAALILAPKDGDTLEAVADAYANLGDRQQATHYVGLALKNGIMANQVESDLELTSLMHDADMQALLNRKQQLPAHD